METQRPTRRQQLARLRFRAAVLATKRERCEWPECRAPAQFGVKHALCGPHFDLTLLFPTLEAHYLGPKHRRGELVEAHWHVRDMVDAFPREHGRQATLDDVASVYDDAYDLLRELVDQSLVDIGSNGGLTVRRGGWLSRLLGRRVRP